MEGEGRKREESGRRYPMSMHSGEGEDVGKDGSECVPGLRHGLVLGQQHQHHRQRAVSQLPQLQWLHVEGL